MTTLSLLSPMDTSQTHRPRCKWHRRNRPDLPKRWSRYNLIGESHSFSSWCLQGKLRVLLLSQCEIRLRIQHRSARHCRLHIPVQVRALCNPFEMGHKTETPVVKTSCRLGFAVGMVPRKTLQGNLKRTGSVFRNADGGDTTEALPFNPYAVISPIKNWFKRCTGRLYRLIPCFLVSFSDETMGTTCQSIVASSIASFALKAALKLIRLRAPESVKFKIVR